MANSITLLRIILSFGLLFIRPYGAIFFLIYTVCGLTDILDGYIARKTKTESNFGAKLDTISDLVFFSVVIIVLSDKIIKNPAYMFFIVSVCAIRLVSIVISFLKYRQFFILHTYGNKLTGFLLFFVPYFIGFDISFLFYVVGGIALVSSVEELLINMSSKTLELNIVSINKWKVFME